MAQAKESRADQLLETATLLFKEKGYHNTSMQDLADALGLQKGSLYYYIESKEELLRRLLEQATSFLATQVDDLVGIAADVGRKEIIKKQADEIQPLDFPLRGLDTGNFQDPGPLQRAPESRQTVHRQGGQKPAPLGAFHGVADFLQRQPGQKEADQAGADDQLGQEDQQFFRPPAGTSVFP